MRLIPKDWNELQQYKDRKPLWIKLHRELLNDFSYSSVQIGTKATLPLLWLLACEYEDGVIDASIEEISFRIHIDIKTLNKAIEELIECNFFTTEDLCTEAYETVLREETEKRQRREEKKTDMEIFKDNIVSKMEDYPTINKEAFKEWLKYKLYKTIAPITKTLNFLTKYDFDTQQQIVDTSIMNNYKGLFEPKQSNKPQQSFKQQDKQQHDQEISYALENNIFDIIDEMDKIPDNTIQGEICG